VNKKSLDFKELDQFILLERRSREDDYSIEYLQRQKMLDIKGLFDVPGKRTNVGNLCHTKSNKV